MPNIPGTAPPVPSVPAAVDLPSALAAINALRHIVQVLQSQINPSSQNPTASNPADFFEKNRITKKFRIYNPTDSSQYVDVAQIVSLTFENALGQKIVWTQHGMLNN